MRLASFCHYFVVVFFKKEKQQKVKELGITLGHVDNKESCTKKHLKSVQQNMRHLVDSGEKKTSLHFHFHLTNEHYCWEKNPLQTFFKNSQPKM